MGRQKLLGFVKAGKKIDEHLPLGCVEKADLSLKFSADGETIFCTLIGTPDQDLLVEPSSDEYLKAASRFGNNCCITATEKLRVVTKLHVTAEFNYIEPPRDGKKLLVLDLDVYFFHSC